ncbi:MAG: hypothetical protein J6U64_05250 [Alphaproteobacteria bacterium]|nr:hypothetical protein [Alphaproteobacteria bacterium]
MAEVISLKDGDYDILQNEAKEILIAIKARITGMKSPQIIYDGEDRVLFYRNPELVVAINDVPEEAREAIMDVSKVLMVEVHDDSIVSEYMVPIKKVPKIPVFG